MGLLIKHFFTVLTILSSVKPLSAAPLNAISLSSTQLSETPLKCISVTNQKCKVRPEIVSFISDDTVFYPFSNASKCSHSLNNIDYPYAKICVPDVIKNINNKVFNVKN